MRGYSVVSGWMSSMQRLLVHALALRQLGRLRPHRLTAPAAWHTEGGPRAVHGCSAFPAVAPPRAAGGAWLRLAGPLHQLRFKSNKKKGSARPPQEEEEAEEEVEEEAAVDPEDSDYEDENPNLPKDYKDVEKNVQSFRYDVIMKAGLDMARTRIEEAFYDNRLRLNGHRLIKKSKTVKVGDTLDLVLSENRDKDTVAVMRVSPRRVSAETTSTDKYKVVLRRWKYVELSRDEAFKP